ncbi:MAG: hypothetical protein K1X83_00225 [Oligoflexia bacterium]|nr:hypothetical protein [Oligoflexia bacterium]
MPSIKELVDEGFDLVGKVFGQARETFSKAYDEAKREADAAAGTDHTKVDEVLAAGKGAVDLVMNVAKQTLQPEDIRTALRSSAHIWELIQANGVADGMVKAPDGTPKSGKFDGFEGLVVDIGTERQAVTIGKLGGKEFLLILTTPADMTSNVTMGKDGFDDIQAWKGILIGTKGKERFIVDPVTGGATNKIPEFDT